MMEFGLIDLVVFWVVFIFTFWLLCHIEYKMWEDWYYRKNSWWNILYKKR